MGVCEREGDSPLMVALLYFSVALGVFATGTVSVVFAWKWHMKLDSESKHSAMPRLSAVIVYSLSLERILQLAEVFAWYNLDRWVADVLYHLNILVAFLGIYAALMSLLLVKLDSSFRKSIYELKSNEKRVIHGLIIATFTLQCTLASLLEVKTIVNSTVGSLLLSLGVLLSLALNVTTLGKLDYGFSSRLRKLVASSASISIGSSSSNSSIDVFGHQSVTSMSSSMNTFDAKGTADESDFVVELQKQKSVSFKESTVKSYEKNHQRLLSSAAKSLVLASWVTLGLFLYTLAVIMFVIGHCADTPTILGYILVWTSFIVIGVAITLAMPYSKQHYHDYCSHCNSVLIKFVSWQTNKQIVQELQSQRQKSADI